MPTLDDAINVIRTGNREQGREILEEILETDENNEEVWLWLSSVVDSDEDREICLENVLAINPDNIVAQKGLEALRQGTFNVHNMMEEALEDLEEIPEEQEDDFSTATFLDEFSMADEDEEEELEFPSTMKPPKKGGGLNVRIILIIILVLCVVLALGSAAAYNVLSGDGGDSGPVDVPSQETPADGGQPEPAATDTPIPTETPTPTNTPFQLPTKEPTPEPTPTATVVVSPTSPTN
jgi:hypothetical protein